MRTLLHVIPTSGVGGVETLVHLCAKFHDRTRWNPVFVFFRPGPLVSEVSRHAKTKIIHKPPRLRNPIGHQKTQEWLGEMIRENQANAVIGHLAYTHFFSGPAARRANIPGFWFQHGPVTGMMDRLAGLMPTEGIVCNSKHTLERQRRLQILERRLAVVYPGIEISESSLATVSDPTTFKLGLFCRFSPQKGIGHLLEGLRALRERNLTRKVLIQIFSGDGKPEHQSELQKNLMALAKKEFSEGPIRVEWHPETWNVHAAIQKVDGILCTSIKPEGFGLTLIEGMAYGKVVLAPCEGGPSEFVHTQKNGLLYQPRSAFDLAEKISILVNSIELQTQLGSEGRQDYLKLFTARAFVKRLENQLEAWMDTLA